MSRVCPQKRTLNSERRRLNAGLHQRSAVSTRPLFSPDIPPWANADQLARLRQLASIDSLGHQRRPRASLDEAMQLFSDAASDMARFAEEALALRRSSASRR